MRNNSPKKYVQKTKSTFMRLLGYIVNNSGWMFAAVCVTVVLSAAANIYGSIFSQKVVDDYITPMIGAANPDYGSLIKALLSMAAIYLFGVICTLIYNKFMVRISQGCLKSIRDDMFYHMQSLPVSYFDSHTHGDVMSYFTNDTDTLRQFISNALAQLVSCVITAVASFVVMCVFNWALALFVSVAGFDKCNEELYHNSSNANTYANYIMPVLGQVGNLLCVIMVFVGGLLILDGYDALTVGIVIAFVSLSKSFSSPIQQVGQQISLISMAMAGAKRIFNLLDEQSETDEGYVTLVNAKISDNGKIEECSERTGKFAWKHPHGDGTITYTELCGDIRLFDVDFGYVPDKIVLHSVTVYAEEGQKIAFVGATGAGKTTITNLLNRLYDIADGKIRYDGININKIKKADLRRSIGLVLQDTHLFTDTVLENIRYGRLNATDEECIAAAKLTGADTFISNLPYGYNTVLLNAGMSLSQGQRQLLNISRAVVADPPVLILDEATSSIDTRTERLIQEGMDALMHGRSSFVIAHRLSTIRNSDVIMVLDHGRIIERGSHESLMQKKGTYYRLYTGAFELE